MFGCSQRPKVERKEKCCRIVRWVLRAKDVRWCYHFDMGTTISVTRSFVFHSAPRVSPKTRFFFQHSEFPSPHGTGPYTLYDVLISRKSNPSTRASLFRNWYATTLLTAPRMQCSFLILTHSIQSYLPRSYKSITVSKQRIYSTRTRAHWPHACRPAPVRMSTQVYTASTLDGCCGKDRERPRVREE